jgi:predicted nuclease with RNAse H fold
LLSRGQTATVALANRRLNLLSLAVTGREQTVSSCPGFLVVVSDAPPILY